MKLSDRITGLKPSTTIELANKAKALKSRGNDIIELGGGDPDFNSPEKVTNAAILALREGRTHYSLSRGSTELRLAVSDKLHRKNGLSYDPDVNLLIAPGAKQAIYYVLLSLLNPGDEVLVPEPSWVSYPQVVLLAGGKPILVPGSEESPLRCSGEQLKKHVTEKTKAVLWANPNNPTGLYLDRDEQKAVADVAREYDLFVISDEIYENILFGGREFVSMASLDAMKERTALINGFSKAYAMTGWRLGYLAGPDWLISASLKIQQQTATCVSEFVQAGGIAALNSASFECQYMSKKYENRCQRAVEILNQVSFMQCDMPEGTFYLFPSIKQSGLSSDEFSNQLLEQCGITSIPGNAFGPSGEGYIRLNVAVSDVDLDRALDKILVFEPCVGG